MAREYSLDKNSEIPLYSQLKNDIIDRIDSGEYEIGYKLPSEKELMKLFDITRTTVRQAVDILVREGYLELKRGVGTFVKKQKKYNVWGLEELRSFEDEAFRQGLETRTELKKDYNVIISYAKKTFRALNVDRKDAELLEIEEKTAIQLVKTMTYNDLGEPFEYSISRDRGDMTRFSAILKYKN